MQVPVKKLKSPSSRTRSRRHEASIMIDVLMSAFVCLMVVVGMFAAQPAIRRTNKISSDRMRGVQMMSRLIEHVQMVPAASLDRETLASLNLIEAESLESPYAFTRIPLDEASRYSPAQVLRNADGRLEIESLPDGSKAVRLTLSYDSATGHRTTLQSGTVVGVFR